jgi:hypothetical protein
MSYLDDEEFKGVPALEEEEELLDGAIDDDPFEGEVLSDDDDDAGESEAFAGLDGTEY